MSSAVAKSSNEVAEPAQQQQAVTETKEASASANASVRTFQIHHLILRRVVTESQQAGINLNIFGAIAGAFSGKSQKETAADGSSTEHREDRAKVKGIAELMDDFESVR